MPVTKAYRGVEVELHSFLTSELGGSVLSALRSTVLTLGEIFVCIYRAGVWLDPRAGLDGLEWRKIPYLCREFNHVPSVVLIFWEVRMSSCQPCHLLSVQTW